MDLTEEQRRAFTRITTWMESHGANVLAENLALGASPATLDALEVDLGFALPVALRTLWSIHDGQHEELNGFFEMYDLYSTEWARSSKDFMSLPLEFARASDDLSVSSATDTEISSDAWIVIAGRDSNGIAVCALTGRVFEIWHDDLPPLVLCAGSVTEWLTSYAKRIEDDDYRVEEGFGDCFLALRDRAREAQMAEYEKKKQDELRRRAESPLFSLLDEAIRTDTHDLCQDVVARAHAESSSAFDEIVTSLFVRGASPAFIARSLRLELDQLNVSPAQWRIIAEGAETIGNNAIRDIALARSRAN